jgi:EAL domain-containing protein (putative c-di-GMP-specific phosphodiesterase class I)
MWLKSKFMDLKYKKINELDGNNFRTVLHNYKFSTEDALNLKSIQTLVTLHTEELLKGFYKFIFEFNHARMFLHDKDILARHEKGIELWYKNLFCGKYEEEYFEKLNFISEIHVRIGLPAHYVNAAFSYVRGFIKNCIVKEKRFEVLTAVDKIIDINLDILTIAYREEEQTKFIDNVVLLKNTLDNGSIEPHIQPIFDANNSEVKKYECLMRLVPEEGATPLSVFPYLETAKKIKLYSKMMDIMINKSIDMFCHMDTEFSINLSYEDISNDSFREMIYEKIKTCSNPEYIIFEILESDFIEDFSIVEEFSSYVRTFGCKIAIDDFGSGYSSMENILKLKPDIIKIDGSLIKNIDVSEESKMIVKNIINMAKDLNAQTVAEYIHTEEVYAVTNNLGVDFLQGFYLGEPKEFGFYFT